ncbi:MAG: SDR family NAD(P)-dependent oxidoreductase, partial [Candidatus Eremiobacteraeota bacterium]|nr:SDR family NAD(P)-dependent oxidoreductase [Candidatus Eremiobacteraeota bacterium]
MKTMVVTGASSGIGRALTLHALRAGFNVVAVGREAGKLAELAGGAAEKANLATLAADVGAPGTAQRIVEMARMRFARIDVLVNNAGMGAAGALVEQSDGALLQQFTTHVVGPLALVREAVPLLQASRGQVLMVGSGVARVPVGGLGAYPASKAALRSATATLRRELRLYGIAVTYVGPGVVDTPFMSRVGLAGAPR